MPDLSTKIIDNVITNLPVGLMVIDSRGEIVAANQALSRILGFPEDFFLGKGWGQIFFEETGKNYQFNQVIIDVITTETANLRRTVPYEAPSGESLHLSIVSSFLRSDTGEVGIVVLIQDVTEIQRLHEREKDILARNSDLHREREQGLRTMALSVAHQIRNPVVAIGGFANMMLRNTENDTKTHEQLETILQESVRLEQIVKAVADFASLPAAQTLCMAVCAVFESTRREVEAYAESLGKTIDWDVEYSGKEARVDPELMKHALYEVMINSVDFTVGDKVRIMARGESDGQAYRLTLADQGPGIPQSHLPYVFDPFFTTKTVGVGMGLTKAKRSVVEHRGVIEVRNATGGGAMVVIALPLDQCPQTGV